MTCFHCQAEIGEGASYCKRCGKSQKSVHITQAPGSVCCSYCSRQIPLDAKFCAHCGAPAQNHTVPPVPLSASNSASDKPRRKRKKRLVLLGSVSIVLSLAILIHFTFGDTLWASIKGQSPQATSATNTHGGTLEKNTVPVSPETTEASVSGVSVDFGQYNLLEETVLTVVRNPVVYEKTTGTTYQTYDLTLEGMDEFTALVDVTFPYDPSGIAPENESTAFSVGWFNEETGHWVVLPSTINTQEKTITFQTDSFSPKTLIKNTANQGKSLFYYENNEYKGVNTIVHLDTGAMNKELDRIDSKVFDTLIRDKSVPTNEMISTGLGLTNILTSGADYGDSLSEKLLPSVTGLSSAMKNRLLVVGVVATSLKVVDQWGRGVKSDKIFRDNAFDIAEIAVSGVALAYGSPWIALAGAGIWAVGLYDQMTYDPEDITSYLNKTEEAYDLFTKKQITYNLSTGVARHVVQMPGESVRLHPHEVRLNSEAAWALAIKSIYLQSKGEPLKIQERVNNLVHTTCSLFWEQYRRNESTLYYWLDEQSGFIEEGQNSRRSLQWPEGADKNALMEKYTERQKIRTHDRLQTIYQIMSDREVFDLKMQFSESLHDLRDYYNETIEFALVDPDLDTPGFAKSKLASKTFYLSATGSLEEEFKIVDRPQDTDVCFQCTVYHYLAAGMPDALHMYPDDDTFSLREETFAFETEQPLTTIELRGGDIEGIWDYKATYTDVEMIENPAKDKFYKEILEGDAGTEMAGETFSFSFEIKNIPNQPPSFTWLMLESGLSLSGKAFLSRLAMSEKKVPVLASHSGNRIVIETDTSKPDPLPKMDLALHQSRIEGTLSADGQSMEGTFVMEGSQVSESLGDFRVRYKGTWEAVKRETPDP